MKNYTNRQTEKTDKQTNKQNNQVKLLVKETTVKNEEKQSVIHRTDTNTQTLIQQQINRVKDGWTDKRKVLVKASRVKAPFDLPREKLRL